MSARMCWKLGVCACTCARPVASICRCRPALLPGCAPSWHPSAARARPCRSASTCSSSRQGAPLDGARDVSRPACCEATRTAEAPFMLGFMCQQPGASLMYGTKAAGPTRLKLWSAAQAPAHALATPLPHPSACWWTCLWPSCSRATSRRLRRRPLAKGATARPCFDGAHSRRPAAGGAALRHWRWGGVRFEQAPVDSGRHRAPANRGGSSPRSSAQQQEAQPQRR
jgi:hypothetical protein